MTIEIDKYEPTVARDLPANLLKEVLGEKHVTENFPSIKITPNHQIIGVYGTLRKDFWNNRLLQRPPVTAAKKKPRATTVHLGSALTLFSTFLMTEGDVPMVVNSESVNDPSRSPLADFEGHIKLELYAVDREVLNSADRLEGHPEWYERKVVPVITTSTIEMMDAWLYMVPKSMARSAFKLPSKDGILDYKENLNAIS